MGGIVARAVDGRWAGVNPLELTVILNRVESGFDIEEIFIDAQIFFIEEIKSRHRRGKKADDQQRNRHLQQIITMVALEETDQGVVHNTSPLVLIPATQPGLQSTLGWTGAKTGAAHISFASSMATIT